MASQDAARKGHPKGKGKKGDPKAMPDKPHPSSGISWCAAWETVRREKLNTECIDVLKGTAEDPLTWDRIIHCIDEALRVLKQHSVETIQTRLRQFENQSVQEINSYLQTIPSDKLSLARMAANLMRDYDYNSFCPHQSGVLELRLRRGNELHRQGQGSLAVAAATVAAQSLTLTTTSTAAATPATSLSSTPTSLIPTSATTAGAANAPQQVQPQPIGTQVIVQMADHIDGLRRATDQIKHDVRSLIAKPKESAEVMLYYCTKDHARLYVRSHQPSHCSCGSPYSQRRHINNNSDLRADCMDTMELKEKVKNLKD